MLKLIFFVFFLDLLAFSAIIPLLPLLFFDCPDCQVVANIPHSMRYLLLGALYAIYPLAQALAAPLLGKYSDKYGRKGILLVSYLGNACGYLLCGYGLMVSSITPLFIGNFIAGLTGANIFTINALISDRSKDLQRKKNFGIFYMLFGLAFTAAPLFSSFFLDYFQDLETFCLSLFIGGSALSFVNFLIIFFFFAKEAPKNPVSNPTLKTPNKERQKLLYSIFFLIFGWYTFIKGFQVFLIEKADFHQSKLLTLVSFYGLSLFLSQVLYVNFFHKWIRSKQAMLRFMFLLAGSILSLVFVKEHVLIFAIMALLCFAYSMISPSLITFFSEFSNEEEYGHNMGLHQSMSALAKIIAPLTAGLAASFDSSFSIIVSSLAISTCAIMISTSRSRVPIAG